MIIVRTLGTMVNKFNAVTLVPIYDHGSISLVVATACGKGAVDRDLLVVRAKAMTMGVRVRKQTTLQ